MKKLKLTVFFLITILILYNCKKEDTTKKDNLSENQLDLDSTGYAYLCDTNGLRKADNSGINVSVEGTSISTTTDFNGKWSIPRIKTDTITIVFAKPNYGTIKFIANLINGNIVQIYGNFNLNSLTLYRIPLYTTTLLTDTLFKNGMLWISGLFNGKLPSVPWCHLFVNKNSNVSSNPANYLWQTALNQTNFQANFNVGFSTDALYSNGFASGDSVYIVSYSDFWIPASHNSFEAIQYLDRKTGRNVYPNLNPNPSNILRFILP